MKELRSVSIQNLIEELRTQNSEKYDIITPSKNIRMEEGNFVLSETNRSLSTLLISEGITMSQDDYIMEPTQHFHNQVGDKLGIPRNYYNKMLNHKGLLNENVNYWFNDENKNMMLRTFKSKDGSGVARALLSDRFRTIDNWDILITVLDVIKNHPNIRIEATDLSETKMYIRFYDPSVEVQAPELLKNYRNPKDGGGGSPSIISGFTISNSEVGAGTFTIAPRGIALICSNGWTKKSDQLRQVHLGARKEEGIIEWSEETSIQNMRLIQSQTKDAIKTFLSPQYWNKVIEGLNEDGIKKLEYPIDCTKNVSKHLGLSDTQVENVLSYFIDGGQSNRMGVANALTFFAHETEDADLQYKVEENALELVPVMQQFDKQIKK